MLQKEFSKLVLKYTDDRQLKDDLWNEIEGAYGSSERHFHCLSHLEQLLKALSPVRPSIEDWDTLIFAVFYHDIVYDVVQYVTANDNEDQSALTAEKTLRSINFPEEKIERCTKHILATKHHRQSSDPDTNLLIDADLSILGQPWDIYLQYLKNIRQEYIIYPDNIYKAGRIKVLRNFLQMDQLYKTRPFYDLYETDAMDNISRELEILSFS